LQNGSPNRNGGRHRCQPPSAPSLDPPVFASLTVRRPSATRSWLTRSGVASSIWSCPKAGSETFCGPSWAGTLRVACPQGEPRTARGNANSSGASSGGPTWNLRSSSSPSGADRSFRHQPHLLAVAGFPGRRELPPRSQLEPAKLFRVGEAKNANLHLWITGISCTTRRVGNKSAIGRLFG
jgi:hypothetical protein